MNPAVEEVQSIININKENQDNLKRKVLLSKEDNNPDIKAVTSKSYLKQMETKNKQVLSSDPKKQYQQKSISRTVSNKGF